MAKLILISLYLVCLVSRTCIGKEIYIFPQPNTERNRFFIQILHHNLHHFDSLQLLLNEFNSMCEGGWEPTIMLHTCANYSQFLMFEVVEKLFCYRINKFLPITVRQYDSDIGVWLAAPHRRVAKEFINNFDLFMYIEDDMIFTYSHLTAYIRESLKLQKILPENSMIDYSIGFQRFRTKHFAKEDIVNEGNVIQEFLEELPTFDHVCWGDVPYVVCHEEEGGVHQALWILTKEQLLELDKRCQYLDLHTGQRCEFLII
jgi:hypothetical protein